MNDGIHKVSQTLRRLVEKELDPGERVMWSAQPLRGTFVRKSIPFVFFGFFWMAIVGPMFVAIWTGPDATRPEALGARLFILPFLLIGLVMLTSPLWAVRQARNTVYVITDRRALSFKKALGSTVIKSFLPHQLRNLERLQRNDGSGDIMIEHETVYRKGRPHVRSIGFEGIPHVKQVEDLLETLASAELSGRSPGHFST